MTPVKKPYNPIKDDSDTTTTLQSYDLQLDADVDSMESFGKKSKIVGTSFVKGFKERKNVEQIEQYESVRRAHMFYRLNGFDTPDGFRILQKIEFVVREAYDK